MTFQLGFATTQICEAVAVAVQTLLAREIADEKSRSAEIRTFSISYLIKLSLLAGASVATLLSLTTMIQQNNVLAGLTSSLPIREAAKTIFPVVLFTQGTFLLHI